MEKQQIIKVDELIIEKDISFLQEMKKNKFRYLIALPGILFFLVFSYIPMAGIIIAFQDFNPIKGVFGSQFIGLDNFKFFFASSVWKTVTFNTLYLNVLFILTGTIASIAIAIMLTEVKDRYFKTITQTLMTLPNFASWAIVAMLSATFFASDIGLINVMLKNLHLHQISFTVNAKVWPTTLVMIRLWKGAGFGAIVYMAAITGLDQEIYEAARIDGASRLQSIFKITLPLLKNTVVLLTLLSVGGIFYGDIGMIYTMVGDNTLLLKTTDVIDTYVFRSLRTSGSMGMSAAVGLYQSFIGFILVLASNSIAKRISKDSAIF